MLHHEESLPVQLQTAFLPDPFDLLNQRPEPLNLGVKMGDTRGKSQKPAADGNT